MKPDHFLTTHPLFTRGDLIAALPGRAPATVDAHLARWVRQGRLLRVKNGLYVGRQPESTAIWEPTPDYIALAARMAPDAAAAYHTALEAHGCAQSLADNFTFVTWTRVRAVAFRGRRLAPVQPRCELRAGHGNDAWIDVLDRGGLEVRVTSLERTVADVLDRPSLAGGLDEVWRSLMAVPAIDPEALLAYVRVLANRTLAARVGFLLDTRQRALAVPDATLAGLESLLPAQPVHLDRALGGRLVPRWRLIVPVGLGGRAEEGDV